MILKGTYGNTIYSLVIYIPLVISFKLRLNHQFQVINHYLLSC